MVYFRKNWGISINEGYFPNLTVTLKGPFFYLALTHRWKFIFGRGNFRFGPLGAKR